MVTPKEFLSRKIVPNSVDETYINWKEALSYAAGRGAQGMTTSMTASKYVNYFITNVLNINMTHASVIRLCCGIFDAINDPIMGVLVDKTRTKYGKMRPYIKFAPYFVALFILLFFIGSDSLSYGLKLALTVFAFVGLDVTYTAFDVPMGALAFSMTPNGTERTKLYGISAIGRMILGAIPTGLVAFAAWLPYFRDHLDKAYLTAAVASAAFVILLTRLTFRNTRERLEHHEGTPGLKECLRLLISNRPLFMLFLGNVIFILIKIPEQVSFYFTYDSLYAPRFNGFIDIAKAPGSVLAALIVPLIVEKLGEKADSRRFYQACCVVGAIVNALFGLTTFPGVMNKPADQPVSLFTGILVVAFTMLATIPLEFKNLMQKEMEAETVDYVEYRSGKRVEGTMLSIMSFTGKLEGTLSSSAALWILGLTKYVEHEKAETKISVVQNTPTRWALFLMTTAVPILGWLLMLLPIHFYNITGKGHREMMQEIMKRRAAQNEIPQSAEQEPEKVNN